MTIAFIHIETAPCAHCNRPASDHDEDSNDDINCPGYLTADDQYAREIEASAVSLYEALQEEVSDQ